MERQAVIQTTYFGRVNSRVRSTAVALVCSGALTYVVLAAPAVASFAIAIALAVAWCRWLESHPSSPAAGETQRAGDLRDTASRPAASVTLAWAILLVSTAPASAQPATSEDPRTGEVTVQAQETDPNPGRLTLTGSLDAVSTYMFRGIRQNSTGIALWPVADAGISLFSGQGGLKTAAVNIGTWNSLHTGDTGADGATGKLWYESDFYATLGLGCGAGTSLAATYTAYTSPNNAFTTVKEVMFKAAVDDSARLGRAALKPYAIVALEFDTRPGVGQADGGSAAGRYLELGVTPGYSATRASLAVPVKIGISLANYYERNTGTADAPVWVDDTFGFFSVGGIVTVPVGATSGVGAWNLHGGIEYQSLGDTARGLNGGDRSRVIASAGIGFSY